MTDHDETVRAALDGLTTPAPGDNFWDRLDRRLDAEDRDLGAGGQDPDRRRRSRPGGPVPVANPAGPAPTVVGLHDREDRRRRGPWIARIAAAVLVMAASAAVAVGLTGGLDDTSRLGTAPATGPTPTAVPAPTSTRPDTTTANDPIATTTGRPGDARAVALAWIDHLAAGEIRAAWDLLGPTARGDWGSYDRFAAMRTGFAEGLGSWASAPDRTVSTVTVSTGAGDVHVVTLSGVRQVEGTTELAAVAIPVIEDGDGELRVERRGPIPDLPVATAPDTGADPVRVIGLDPDAEVVVMVDGDAPVAPDRDGGTATHRPAGGWAPGRHTVTAGGVGGPGAPMAVPVVFDIR